MWLFKKIQIIIIRFYLNYYIFLIWHSTWHIIHVFPCFYRGIFYLIENNVIVLGRKWQWFWKLRVLACLATSSSSSFAFISLSHPFLRIPKSFYCTTTTHHHCTALPCFLSLSLFKACHALSLYFIINHYKSSYNAPFTKRLEELPRLHLLKYRNNYITP